MLHALAFEYTPGWGALLAAGAGVVGSLGGVVLNQRSNRRNERERASEAASERAADRQHERDLREIELRAELRGRLYADRRSAYAAFRRKFLAYQSATVHANDVFLAVYRKPAEEWSSEEARAEAQKEFFAAAQRADDLREEVEASLADVEVVASAVVYDAAVKVRERAEEVGKRHLQARRVRPDKEDEWAEAHQFLGYAERLLSNAEAGLRAAIREELELDR